MSFQTHALHCMFISSTWSYPKMSTSLMCFSCMYWTGVSDVGHGGRGGKCHNTFVRGAPPEAPLYMDTQTDEVKERVKRGEGGREGKEEGECGGATGMS